MKFALIQMLVEGGRREANLERAEVRIAEAAANGAQVVVLPEALDLGWTHPSAGTEAGAIPGGIAFERLRACAARHQIHLCAGLVERADDLVFNAAVLLGPDGRLLLHHRKLNELEIGHEYYTPGDRLGVAHTPLGAFGLMICADAFARGQIVTRTLGLMGADIILSPCAWAVPAEHDHKATPYGQLWRDNYQPVARDFRLWIAGVSNVGWINAGPWEGSKCIGCSLLIGPGGEEILQGPYGPEADTILYHEAKIEPRPAQGCGWERLWEETPRG